MPNTRRSDEIDARRPPLTRRALLRIGLGGWGAVASAQAPIVVAAPAPPPPVASASPATAWLTTLDGEAALLRGADRHALAEGVVLQADDAIDVPASGRLARLEFADGLSLALGPGSRLWLAPRLATPGRNASPGPRAYLLSGWVKLAAPAGASARLAIPSADVSTIGGTLVLSVGASATTLFAEAGTATLDRRGEAPRSLRTGEAVTVSGTGADAKVDVSPRPPGGFVAALPRPFMDTLPSRLARVRTQPVEPRRTDPIAYADAQPWLDAEPRFRQAQLARWRPLARDAEFRRALVADLNAHPEWRPILFPPPPPAPKPAPAGATPAYPR